MSKQSDAKLRQGYVQSPIPTTCPNCNNYRSKKKERSGIFSTWIEESDKRCGLGGFAVKKMATCEKFQPKQP